MKTGFGSYRKADRVVWMWGGYDCLPNRRRDQRPWKRLAKKKDHRNAFRHERLAG